MFPILDVVNDDTDEYVMNLQESIVKVYEVARKTLKPSQEIMKRNYDLMVSAKAYYVGDPVYLLDQLSRERFNTDTHVFNCLFPAIRRTKGQNKIFSFK